MARSNSPASPGQGTPTRHIPLWQPIGIAAFVTVFCVLLLFLRPSLIDYLDNRIYDRLMAKVPRNAPTNLITIVDIDDVSLAKVGHWPWSPDLMAQLIRRLHDAQASVVALDIIVPDLDARRSEDDKELSAALGKGTNVVGYDFVFEAARKEPPLCPTDPTPLLPQARFPYQDAGIKLLEAVAVVCDVPAFAARLSKDGFTNIPRDRDGVLRSLPLLGAYRGAVYPSFALAALTANSTASQAALVRGGRDLLWLEWNGKRIALTDGGSLFLRFRGPSQTLPHHSAVSVLEGTVRPEEFRGKIVLVGSSARGVQESVETRLEPAFSGLEAQATLMDNLIAGDYLYQPRWAHSYAIVSIALAALATVSLLFRSSALLGMGSTLFLAIFIWAASQAIILIKGAFVSPLFGICSCVATLSIYAVRIVFRESLMGRERQEEVAVANRFIAGALGAMTAVRDVETGQHVVRIQAYLRSLCQVVATHRRFADYLTPEMIDLLVQLAPIHDIGKVGVPDHILRKPGALTPDEYELMKSHVTLGRKILAEAREQSGLRNEVFFQTATEIVYSHHERWDGSGYPLGLRGEAIPIPGRLLALADVYDALISKRHYKPEFLHTDAVERIRRSSGSHFDPDIVDAFLKVQDTWRSMAESHRDDPGIGASAT